ncbi:MAG TPA: NfeD family protein [Candidatus Binatus sp.]|nr:NfeD family protein [Candidatus Binatus sp.]
MNWWIWILIGLLLVLAEVVTPGGFYLLFFGIGGLIVGLLTLVGIAGPTWLQVLLFSVISLCALWLFRQKLMQLFQVKAQRPVDSFVGEMALAVDPITANGVGKVELRGASWSARNIGELPLDAGGRCIVERIEGLTLFVRAENR